MSDYKHYVCDVSMHMFTEGKVYPGRQIIGDNISFSQNDMGYECLVDKETADKHFVEVDEGISIIKYKGAILRATKINNQYQTLAFDVVINEGDCEVILDNNSGD